MESCQRSGPLISEWLSESDREREREGGERARAIEKMVNSSAFLQKISMGQRRGTVGGDSQANFQARLKRLRESLSLLSAGADNPKWVHAKWKRQRNLRSHCTSASIPSPKPATPLSPLSITLWYLPCSKVCQQSTRTSGRDNKQCAAVVPGKLPLQRQNFSMQATKIIAIKHREREKEREGRERMRQR